MDIKIILDFLKKLQENNEKEWFHSNKKEYEKAKSNFKSVITELIGRITLFDENLLGLEAKQTIFRINRDIRFSKNKAPYKENFGASMSKGGRKSKFAGYYLHLQPNNKSFLAGGSYMPQAAELAAIRQEIDYNQETFERIVLSPTFKRFFGELRGDSLKTAPRGYAKDHPAIHWIRMKGFIMWHELTDEQVLQNNFLEHALEVFKAMKPLNDFLNTAIEETE